LHRVPTSDVHVSPVQFEEKVIVFNVRRHPAALADATRAYAEATSSSVRFLKAKNEHMAKELQAAKQGEEQLTTSARENFRRAILDEVSSLDTVVQKL